MPRFFLEPESWGGQPALSGDEAVHCARVMRAVSGDVIHVFDGRGRSATATVLSVSKNLVTLELGSVQSEPEPMIKVVLCQAVLKGKAMDWLIQKAVELGVHEIRPVVTEHTVVKAGDSKADKWRRAALEACKQSGRARMPAVLEPVPFNEFLTVLPPAHRIIASLAEPRKPLREQLGEARDYGEIQYLVGPEGDFSNSEVSAALEKGFCPAKLGPHVLRSETAAIYGLAAIACEFNG